jgi:copper chaperone CopZ
VRSALLSVRGVQRADVLFERHEAVVEYDPTQCTVNDLVSAVANAKDPTMPVRFAATVKK